MELKVLYKVDRRSFFQNTVQRSMIVDVDMSYDPFMRLLMSTKLDLIKEAVQKKIVSYASESRLYDHHTVEIEGWSY